MALFNEKLQISKASNIQDVAFDHYMVLRAMDLCGVTELRTCHNLAAFEVL